MRTLIFNCWFKSCHFGLRTSKLKIPRIFLQTLIDFQVFNWHFSISIEHRGHVTYHTKFWVLRFSHILTFIGCEETNQQAKFINRRRIKKKMVWIKKTKCLTYVHISSCKEREGSRIQTSCCKTSHQGSREGSHHT